MTRREFVDQYYDPQELAEAVKCEYGIEVPTIYDEGEFNEYIDEWVGDAICHKYWYEVANYLDYVRDWRGYEYYIIDGIDEICGYDTDDMLQYIIEYLEDNYFFDEDEEEEEDEYEYDTTEDDFECGDVDILI